jgi:hypothetical protein
MTKTRRVVSAALLLGAVCVAAGVYVWRSGGPSGPARGLVGAWEILDSEFEGKIKDAIEKKDPEAARIVGDKFRSTERVRFDRNGGFRHVQDFAGMTISTEGTWRLVRSDGNTLTVGFSKQRLSVRDPKGQTKEEAQDTTFEWVVTVVGRDQLSATATADGQSQRFALRRVGD